MPQREPRSALPSARRTHTHTALAPGRPPRAGAPDALDQMVAKGFGTLAVQQIAEGRTGFMTAVRDGNYTTVPADTCVTGRKRVDIDAFYDTGTYRPRVAKVLGMPMFLY